MKQKLFMIFSALFFSVVSSAAPDVPWPVYSQEAVRISDMTGTWVSVNLKDPGVLYFFSFTANNFTNSSCPYLLTVEEMNPFEKKIVSKGWSTVCQIKQSSVSFKLYDADGYLRNKIEIVGVHKNPEETGLGQQFLGVMIYSPEIRPQLLTADLFFKYSDKTIPEWPL